MDLLANYEWDGPIYFVSQGGDLNIGIKDYLRYDGMAYKLMPFKIEEKTKGFLEYRDMDTEKMYDLLMNVYRWGRGPTGCVVGLPRDVPLSGSASHTLYVYPLPTDLFWQGKKKKRWKCLTEHGSHAPLPLHYVVQPSYNEVGVMQAVELYYFLGQPEKARALAVEFLDETFKAIEYFCNRTRADFFLHKMQNLPSVRTCM